MLLMAHDLMLKDMIVIEFRILVIVRGLIGFILVVVRGFFDVFCCFFNINKGWTGTAAPTGSISSVTTIIWGFIYIGFKGWIGTAAGICLSSISPILWLAVLR